MAFAFPAALHNQNHTLALCSTKAVPTLCGKYQAVVAHGVHIYAGLWR